MSFEPTGWGVCDKCGDLTYVDEYAELDGTQAQLCGECFEGSPD